MNRREAAEERATEAEQRLALLIREQDSPTNHVKKFFWESLINWSPMILRPTANRDTSSNIGRLVLQIHEERAQHKEAEAMWSKADARYWQKIQKLQREVNELQLDKSAENVPYQWKDTR